MFSKTNFTSFFDKKMYKIDQVVLYPKISYLDELNSLSSKPALDRTMDPSHSGGQDTVDSNSSEIVLVFNKERPKRIAGTIMTDTGDW